MERSLIPSGLARSPVFNTSRLRKRLLVSSGSHLFHGIYCGMWHNGTLYASSFATIASTTDGINWTSLVPSFYGGDGSPAGIVGGGQLGGQADSPEGLFIASDGTIFLSSGLSQKILVNHVTTIGQNTTWTVLKAADGTTDFVFQRAQAGGATGSRFNQWGIWEVENSWEASPPGLQVGDIIVGQYHATTSYNARAGFIYRMRKISGQWRMLADPATMLPQTSDDPFLEWNSFQARLVRHVHNVTVGRDGYLYFTTGDSVVTNTISASSAVMGGEVTLTVPNHQLPSGARVYVQNHTGITSINNQEWTVTVADANSIKLNGSSANATSGSGGTITPRWAAGDTGNFYRLMRIPLSGGNWELLSGPGKGFTAMTLLDDGSIVMGNDSDARGQGNTQVIQICRNGQLSDPVWSAPNYLDWPVWDIIPAPDGALYATLQKPGNTDTLWVSRAALLKGSPDGKVWNPLAVSSPSLAGPGWMDFDRILTDRRRRIPSGSPRIVISCQPGNTSPFASGGVYYTLEIGSG